MHFVKEFKTVYVEKILDIFSWYMYVLKFKLKYILIILQNLYIHNFFLSDLFYLSHKLVDLYPNDPVSLLFCFVFFLP